MNAETVAALRELLEREDVLKAALAAAWNWIPADDVGVADVRDALRYAFAAVLELAATLPTPDTDDELRDAHPTVKGAELCDGFSCGAGPGRRAT